MLALSSHFVFRARNMSAAEYPCPGSSTQATRTRRSAATSARFPRRASSVDLNVARRQNSRQVLDRSCWSLRQEPSFCAARGMGRRCPLRVQFPKQIAFRPSNGQRSTTLIGDKGAQSSGQRLRAALRSQVGASCAESVVFAFSESIHPSKGCDVPRRDGSAAKAVVASPFRWTSSIRVTAENASASVASVYVTLRRPTMMPFAPPRRRAPTAGSAADSQRTFSAQGSSARFRRRAGRRRPGLTLLGWPTVPRRM